MKKAKRQTNNFINHLFAVYNVPRIPVYVHWHHDSVTCNNTDGFGVFCFGAEEKPCIHIACHQIKKTGALSTVAHEFVHYLQYLHGWDMDNDEELERAAEYYGAGLMGQWLINKKDKHIRIDGILKVWEKCPEEKENES